MNTKIKKTKPDKQKPLDESTIQKYLNDADIADSYKRMQIMLDANPLCCNFWDENFNNIDCNKAAAMLFDLSSKQEYLDNFFKLSPEFQPCGKLSAEKAKEYISKAFKDGYCRFEWMHQKLNGDPVPSEITLVRVEYGKGHVVLGYTRDLREIKAMEAEKEEANRRVQVMLDATPLCCNFWDEDFNNIDCNQAAATLFDLLSKQEYLDKFFQLSPERQPCGRLSAEMAGENVSKAFKDGYCRFEWMHQKLNGDPVPSEITLVRVEYGKGYVVLGYTRDLREIKAMERETQEANERVKIMLDATPLCCNFWDENLNNVDCNQAAATLFDLSSKQEYLDKFFQLSPERQPCGRLSAEMAGENIAKAFKDGYCRFEWMHQKLNGDPVPSEITLVRVQRGSGFIVAGYTRDLRELKKMLSEIHEVENDLRKARDIAEKNSLAKSEFLANMSHEIRTPINAILGMTYLLLNKTEVTESQRGYLEKTEQSTKLLLRVINDILDFSKIEAGKLEMENVEFSIKGIISDIVGMLSDRIAEKKLKIIVNIPENITDKVKGDPLRLNQVFLNLLSNSIKFTNEGSIEVTVTELNSFPGKILYRFSVSDTGIGMNPEQVKNLFTPFGQADTSITRKYGGTGLGLAICKSLINMMHGEIWCESKINFGSAFYFTAQFDLSLQSNKDERKDDISDFSTISNSILIGKHILLTEDNEINQIIAKELLEMEGLIVDIACDGQEAIDKLKVNRYDLVFMDIQMPVMDGLTACGIIRKNPEFADLPIVAMTAHAMSGDREKSIEAGMNDHITKPLDHKQLYETLLKWIK